MDIDSVRFIMGASTGIGLAAASGFRVFLPPFLLSVWFKLGLMDVDLQGSDFEFLSSDMSLIVMGSASLMEILAYKVPWTMRSTRWQHPRGPSGSHCGCNHA